MSTNVSTETQQEENEYLNCPIVRMLGVSQSLRRYTTESLSITSMCAYVGTRSYRRRQHIPNVLHFLLLGSMFFCSFIVRGYCVYRYKVCRHPLCFNATVLTLINTAGAHRVRWIANPVGAVGGEDSVQPGSGKR